MAPLQTRSSTSSPDTGAVPSGMSRCATALCLCLVLLARPLAAQDNRSLDELIPPEAVADPEAWAGQGAQDAAPAAGPPQDVLEVGSPMEDMPLLTLEPASELELADVEPVQPAEEIEFSDFADVIAPLPVGQDYRLSDELVLVFPQDEALFPERREFTKRFEALSSIGTLDDDGNIARLTAQARADEELLQRMLRIYGYFDAQVIRTIIAPGDGAEAAGEGPVARFEIIPGKRFSIATVDTENLADTGEDFAGLRDAYGVFPGDFISIDAISNQRLELDTALAESGYAFAVVDEPSLLVDHERQQGDVTLPVMPAGKYNFGTVTSDMEDFLSGRHLSEIARFDEGDLYRRSDVTDLRRAILATGLVGSVTVTPVETSPPQDGEPGTVDMAVSLTKAPLRTVTGSLGYGSEEGIRVAASWEHRNLFPPEGMLRFRGIAGTQEQLIGATFRRNNFHGRDRILTIDAFGSTLDTAAYDAKTLSILTSYERVSTLLFQKPLSWGMGLELVASDERELKIKGLKSPNQTFLVAALPSYAQYDTSDDLLDPTQGLRLRGALSPELSRLNGNNSTYLKLQFDLSYYQSMGDNVVLATRARAGSILGTPIFNIAPSRRFYAGGGGSVRGYGYQAIGPRNGLGDPNGGRSLLELSAEARIRTGMLDNSLSLVPFVDAGSVTRGSTPDFSDIRVGVGLGLRYQTNFGPIRLDVATPLNPGPDDAPVAVYVALGQSF